MDSVIQTLVSESNNYDNYEKAAPGAEVPENKTAVKQNGDASDALQVTVFSVS